VRCFTATNENKKIQHGAFLLSLLTLDLTKLNNVFDSGCFHLAQVKASVELCIHKISDAAAKSEFKANFQKFDSELGELGTLVGLVDSCVKWHGVLEGWRKISKLIVPMQIHKKGDRSE